MSFARFLASLIALILPAGVIGLVNTPSASASALVSFSSCDELLKYLEANGDEYAPTGDMARGGVLLSPQEVSSLKESSDSFSSTNVQELGIDEPDFVKNDGDRILIVSKGKLYYVNIAGGALEVVGSIQLPDTNGNDYVDAQLLVRGDIAIAIYNESYMYAMESYRGAAPDYVNQTPKTKIVRIDLSDPVNMVVTESVNVDGSVVSARLVGDSVHVVISNYVYRMDEGSLSLEDLPQVEKIQGRDSVTLPLTNCADVRHPAEPAGTGFTTVLSFNVSGLDYSSSSVVASGSTVYASNDSIFVSTPEWEETVRPALPQEDLPSSIVGSEPAIDEGAMLPPKETTGVHEFELKDGKADYVASGEVDGRIIGQWAMSEHEGNLRVASTTGGWSDDSESGVTVLQRSGDNLAKIGFVGGLGRTEEIKSVRFIGDLGYVVTFRQTDPLYVIDFSDPSSPAVRGELKVDGFSSYLHPGKNGQLIGVGSDADDDGMVNGLQLSLFDINNPAAPSRIQNWTKADAESSIAGNHHGFLYWAERDLVLFPSYTYDGGETLLIMKVDGSGIAELGSVSVQGYNVRPIISDDVLYTVSDTGIVAVDLDNLENRRTLALS